MSKRRTARGTVREYRCFRDLAPDSDGKQASCACLRSAQTGEFRLRDRNHVWRQWRIAEIRSQRGLNYRIEVDGGVALDTVAEVVRAGAEILVAGNAVFGDGNPKINAQTLLKAAVEATLQKV